MKSFRLKSAAFVGALMLGLTMPKVSSLGGLKTVSAPYAGCYECKTLTLDGKDFLSFFSSVCLELDGNGEMVVLYKDKAGKRGEKKLSYEYEEGSKQLTVVYQDGDREIRKSAGFEKGEIIFTHQLDGKILLAVFSSK